VNSTPQPFHSLFTKGLTVGPRPELSMRFAPKTAVAAHIASAIELNR